MIVFERELWAVSPLLPDGKTPTTYTFAGILGKADSASGKGDPAASKPAEKPSDSLKLWDGGSFDFHDILDVINPLQHLPIINSIYRSEVKDEIGAVPRILGSMLYGGGLVGALIGAATALVNIVVEHETGKDLGQHIYTAIFGEGEGTRRTTQLAVPKAGEAAAALAAKSAAANPAGAEKTGAAAVAAAVTATKPATAGKPISAKADAALQAFVAGLAKNASPAAAAAANAAIARRGLRVNGTIAQAALGGAKSGAPAKGDVSTQFRRSDWYQNNQAVLKAQAAALARQRAAAGKSGSNETKSSAAILHLFTAPAGTIAKSAGTTTGKTGTASPAAATVPTAAATGRHTTVKGSGVAGPWVVNEIASGLAKYEALVKARKAGAK